MIKKIGYGLAVLAGLYLTLALALTFWPSPRFQRPPLARPALRELAYQPLNFAARDGARLYGRQFGGPAATTVLLVHGVGSDGSELERPAQLLHEASGARIVVLDLRGHGRSAGRPWSVDHAGQYDEDVSDVLMALRKQAPGGRLVLAGHSMGGGIALRHALTTGAPVDGYLLIAPLLGSTAQTMKAGGSGAGSGAGAQFAIFHTPRLFGVLLFNLIAVHALDQLPILELNQAGRPAYGFAALQSMQPNAPKDYRAALGAIHAPLLLVAGSQDEAFNAAAYPGVVRAYGHGEVMIAPGATHNSVLTQQDSVQKMGQWLRGISPAAA